MKDTIFISIFTSNPPSLNIYILILYEIAVRFQQDKLHYKTVLLICVTALGKNYHIITQHVILIYPDILDTFSPFSVKFGYCINVSASDNSDYFIHFPSLKENII